MAGKLLFRIEHEFGFTWLPVKVRLLESHNFARFVEWYDALDVAIDYAKRELERSAKDTFRPQSAFRVSDHLGTVHWRNK